MQQPPDSRSSSSLAALACAGVFILATALPAVAGDAGKAPVEVAAEMTLFDRLWELPTIYKNDEAGFFNEFRFVGRLHLDAFALDSDAGADQDWIVRRMRIGAKARFFKKLELQVETDFNPQSQFVGDPAYQRLTEASISYKFSDALRVSVGKQRAKFTLDGSTSSNDIITIDRSNLSYNLWFPRNYITGVTAGGKAGPWSYSAGLFSGGTDTKEFGNFDAGKFVLLNLGYDFGKLLGVKSAVLRADYVHNERNIESNATRPFENIGALVVQLDNVTWGFNGEIAGATGYAGQSDIWGVTLEPYFNVTKKLQAVVRYNYIESTDPRGVRLARYDNFISRQRGDVYHEIYAGLNYYIYGNRLKVLNGLSYQTLEDSSGTNQEYHAWQWTTGLRLSF